MPSITGYTAARTQDIEDAIIVSAAVVGGDLILTRHDGGTINAGDIRGGEQIPHAKVATVTSTFGSTALSTFNALAVPLSVTGFVKYRADTKLIIEADTGIFNSADGGFYEVAFLIGSTTTVLFNGYGPASSKSGMKEVTGLAAGTYTVSLRYRKASGGSGTVYDGYVGARNCLKVTETF